MAPFLDSRWYTSTNVAALYAAAGGAPATTPAQDLVDTWASGGAGSDGFAMVFEDAGGTDAPSIYIKDSGTPANDTDINLTDDFDTFNSFLTYTSPSPKIVRQSDGNLKYCAHNTALYSNNLSSTAWTVSNATNVTSQTDPDGGSNAMLLREDGGGTTKEIFDTNNLPTVAGITVYVAVTAKASGSRHLQIRPYGEGTGSAWATYNLSTGAVGNSGGTRLVSAPTPTDLGGGWYRCALIFTTSDAGPNGANFVLSDSATATERPSYTGDSTSGVFLYQAQVTRYPADTTYLPTTSAARFALPIQHDSSNNANGLRVEPASTNLLTYSNDFSTWSQSDADAFTLTAADATGPDGQTSMTKLEITDATNERHRLFLGYTVGSSDDCTHSIYVKPGTLRYVGLRGSGGGWAVAVFDLQTLTVTSEQTDGTATIVDSGIVSVGGGIYRLHLTFNPTGIATPNFLIQAHSTGTPTLDGAVGSETFAGTAGQYIHIFGAQTELGSVPTSPIITTGATATRAVDEISKAATAWPQSNSASTLYVKFNTIQTQSSSNFIAVIEGTTDADFLHESGTTELRARVNNTRIGGALATPSPTGTHKAALAFNGTNQGAAYDGGTAQTSASASTTSGISDLDIGHRSGIFTYHGTIKEILYLPERLTNADLESITT